MIKKVVLALAALAIILPLEVYTWVNWISPFFWSPGVAYTDLAWGYVVIGLAFIGIPVATVGSIFEED